MAFDYPAFAKDRYQNLVSFIKLDQERDSMLAKMADDVLLDRAFNHRSWVSDAQRQDFIQASARRASRRMWERANLNGYITPPGPWDHDLDTHLLMNDPIDFEGGYKCVISLDKEYMIWQSHIELPDGHPYLGMDLDDLNDIPLKCELRLDGNKVHIEHPGLGPAFARYRYIPSFYEPDGTRRFGNLAYKPYKTLLAESKLLIAYFRFKAEMHNL